MEQSPSSEANSHSVSSNYTLHTKCKRKGIFTLLTLMTKYHTTLHNSHVMRWHHWKCL